jgi:sodium/hydrogen antiporter
VPFVEETGALMSLLLWLAFGAVALVPAMKTLTWPMVLYAFLSLTVVRMVPVVMALLGARLAWATVLLVAWFGPRGLASVVFALLALEELGSPTADRAVAVITITVLLSVVVHGATAEPLANWYAKLAAGRPDGSSGTPMPDMPDRRLIRRRSPALG